MRVKDVMTRTPAFCHLDTNLGAVAEMFWNRNCGMLPVVNDQQRVVGVITDRDVCIALGTGNRLPGQTAVEQIFSGRLISCSSDEDVHEVLAKMADARVRRMPAVSADGKLEGIVSIDDIVLRMEPGAVGRAGAVSTDIVLNTLKRIYEPQLPEVAHRHAVSA
jgi:CBS domain-containing protein